METVILETPYETNGLIIDKWIEGDTYETNTGVTIYSGADEPSFEDAAECVANPRTREVWSTPEQIAARRWEVETGGVAVEINGVSHRFDTSRENRAMWLALQQKAQGNPSLVQEWKTLGGDFVELTSADILTVCEAVYSHVQICFDKEREYLATGVRCGDVCF